MGPSTRDRIPEDAAEPATPGSYGISPGGFRLPATTHPDSVRLQVAELPRSLDFYRTVLGMQVLEADDRRALLGAADGRALIELRERAGARPAGQPPRLGLFHYAMLLPGRAALGRFLRHLTQLGVRPGAGDHLVSEALYLNDPDGLGIEVYADRARHTWRRVGRQLLMATEPVDLDDLLRAGGEEPWQGMPAGSVLGHVHLHVADLERAATFYSEGLGLDRISWSYPGALFLSAGGYHHHLGVNTWARGATPADAADARLLEWTLGVPDTATLSAAADSIRAAGFNAELVADDVVAADPWGTGVRLRARPR
jgi:catechol 2,3-dioxygenase